MNTFVCFMSLPALIFVLAELSTPPAAFAFPSPVTAPSPTVRESATERATYTLGGLTPWHFVFSLFLAEYGGQGTFRF